ncbi:MAG: amidohydrolase family protein [Chloroflexota bacterium]
MAYEVVVKGGQVIDPARNTRALLDVGIRAGKIEILAPDLSAAEGQRVIDASGMIVTPGLIDIHTHVAEAIVPLAAAPDQVGVRAGVTTVCDAGSTGYANFAGLREYVIPQAQTDVFCFLHLSPVGEAVIPETGWRHVSADQMLQVIDRNRNIIKGIKTRATANTIAELGIDTVALAKRVAVDAGLPVMVHLGLDRGEALPAAELTAFTRRMLDLLERGDVLTHIFTGRPGGLIGLAGDVMPALRDAIERGVRLDVASAIGHLDFQVARQALAQDILPTTLSTDSTTFLLNAPIPFGLTVLMSEFLALGLSLTQVIEMTTVNAARVLGQERSRGSLGVGMPADLSLLEQLEGNFLFIDNRDGHTLFGQSLLVPRLTIKNGLAVEPSARSQGYAQWSQQAQTTLAQQTRETKP